ncbi:MAG: isoleucine--tRNA ligase, partial [bacterium]
YLTLSPDYEAEILQSFLELVEDDFIYRQLKPIHWCWDCQTALADAEVEYDELKSPSIYVDFNVIDDPGAVLESGGASVMIWTTTPWTLPANVAIAVHPDYTYVEFEDPDGDVHLVAEPLLTSVVSARDWSTGDVEILQKIPGSELEGIGCAHPFVDDRAAQVITSDIVTLEEGTGCVHIAPGHGQEDYAIGREYDLPVLSPVGDDGTYTDEFPDQEGVHVLTADDRIVERLEESGHLFYSQEHSHSYPFCWRCDKPVIFRATPQWFFDVDHKDVRRRILNTLDDIRWLPERGKKRFKTMVEDRPDWCLSRQRAWGVPIPAVQCENCGETVLEPQIIENLIEQVQDQGVSVWYESDVNQFIPDGFNCDSCGESRFSSGNDILDVWFDSGVSHRAVLKNDENLRRPADVYLEGSDQHRGWFQLSMIPSMALENDSPFGELITHGFVVDENGEKMSKSRGNVISPQEIVSENGADILRLWVASEDYHGDLVMGEELLEQVKDKYRRIRNTLKFFLGNLQDFRTFDPSEDALPFEDMHIIDRWFLTELYRLVHEVTTAFQDREFHQAINAINNFCAVEASSLFLDIAKDRLYCEPQFKNSHRSAQTAIYHGATILSRIIAPVLSFTADEAWDYLPQDRSVHEADWPDVPQKWANDSIADDFDALRTVRREIMKTVENSETIDEASEASVTINWNQYTSTLRKHEDILEEWFLVSDVTIEEGSGSETITVTQTNHPKCERCWRYRPSVSGREKYDDDELCDRCSSAVELQKQSDPQSV